MDMDAECVALCTAINKIAGLQTIESCCGHGEHLFKIWFVVEDPEHFPLLLYYCDPCHVGFRWNCYAITDCAMSPVTFKLQSETLGAESYAQALRIAMEIEQHLKGE